MAIKNIWYLAEGEERFLFSGADLEGALLSITKAITVARRGLFGAKTKENKWRRFGYLHNSKPYSIAALLYLFLATFVIEGRQS